MKKETLLDRLYSSIPGQLSKYPQKRLEYFRELLSLLGNPHFSFRSFHITGTKGKGSVAHYLQRGINLMGYQCGLYTSPHIHDERERIQVDDKIIDFDDWSRILGKIFKIVDEQSMVLHFFDYLTATAFVYFQEKKVDYGVIEVGIGAKFDSTIVIDPIASIITTIDIDHKEILGKTLESITDEKSYIIKEKKPVYVQRQNSKVTKILKKKAMEMHSPLIHCKPTALFRKKFPNLYTFQEKNIFLVETLLQKEFLSPNFKYTQEIIKVNIPGRFEKIDSVLIDVAHNRVSIREVVKNYQKYIEKSETKTICIFYTLPKKDSLSIYRLLPKHWDIYFYNLKTPYFKEREHPIIQMKNPPMNILQDIEEVRNLYETNKGAQWIITGSFYWVAEFKKKILKKK